MLGSSEFVDLCEKIADGNPPKIPRMGTLSRIGHPSFCPAFRNGNLTDHASGAGTGEPLGALREEETIHQFRSPFGEGHGGISWAGQSRG